MLTKMVIIFMVAVMLALVVVVLASIQTMLTMSYFTKLVEKMKQDKIDKK